jgi:hypothetical protein
LHQSTRDHDILYADRSSKDEQLLKRPFLYETKYTNYAEGYGFRACSPGNRHNKCIQNYENIGKLLRRRLRRSFDYNINIAVREITVRIVIGLNWFGFSGGFWY